MSECVYCYICYICGSNEHHSAFHPKPTPAVSVEGESSDEIAQGLSLDELTRKNLAMEQNLLFLNAQRDTLKAENERMREALALVER